MGTADIEDYEINVILHCRKSILFSGDSTWIKGNNSEFDITMEDGAYDGAEIGELVGLYPLHELSAIFPEELVGLYRNEVYTEMKA